MTIKLGVVMDPIDRVHFKKDSTLAMLWAARDRGWSISYMTCADLYLANGEPFATARDLQVFDKPDHFFDLGAPTDIPLSERGQWQRWWLVDPLDGTKEFISGSEEFTVNVALIENGRVVFGVVSMPTTQRCYVGGAGLGAWRSDDDTDLAPIRVRDVPPKGEAFTVVASRRHSSPEQERLLAGLSAAVGELQLTNVGSSLKFCLLAEGAADCYPRLAPTSQWDTAAAQGVRSLMFLDKFGEEVQYAFEAIEG